MREEDAKLGIREGVISALEKTGGVITSAGLILAGTFMALTILPLDSLFQIGVTVALGLLVDTFLVRIFLVPSIAFQLGELNWWPSRRTSSPASAPADRGQLDLQRALHAGLFVAGHRAVEGVAAGLEVDGDASRSDRPRRPCRPGRP